MLVCVLAATYIATWIPRLWPRSLACRGRSEYHIHHFRHAVAHVGKHVAIRAQRDRDIGVSEQVLDGVRVDSTQQQQGRAGMPQVVKSSFVWQSSFGQHTLED